ncbi:MAG: hypothetical protein Q4B67_00655 [Eubacteriales bacterium]|nr:hypothetical protein [Eubacteriales bacterium]
MTEGSIENKVYVEVDVRFDKEGNMYPKSIKWEDGRKYDIDRVLDMRPSYSRKAGGQGDLYTVRVQGHEAHLFFERTDTYTGSPGSWFMERSC